MTYPGPRLAQLLQGKLGRLNDPQRQHSHHSAPSLPVCPHAHRSPFIVRRRCRSFASKTVVEKIPLLSCNAKDREVASVQVAASQHLHGSPTLATAVTGPVSLNFANPGAAQTTPLNRLDRLSLEFRSTL